MQEAAGRAGIDLIQDDSQYDQTEAGPGCDPHHVRLPGSRSVRIPIVGAMVADQRAAGEVEGDRDQAAARQ